VHRVRQLMLATALSALLAACGGADEAAPADDQDGTATPGAPAQAEDADSEAEAAETESSAESDAPADIIGSVIVDGVEYGISQVSRCEPFEDQNIDRELELQGFGQAPDGSRVQIDVYVQQIAGMPFDDVSWAGPEGVYGNPDDASVEASDSHVQGTATLNDARGDGTTIEVSFDLPVPAELFACR